MQIETTLCINGQEFRVPEQYPSTACFGNVFAATNLRTDQLVSIKSIPSKDIQVAQQELKILTILNQNVQTSQHNCNNPENHLFYPTLRLIAENRSYNSFQIVTQAFGVSLNKIFDSLDQFDFDYALKIFEAIVKALLPLRKANILHRNLNPDNIFVQRNFSEGTIDAKISDYSLAVQEKDQLSVFKMGPLAYQAPQVIESQFYSQKSEIWSLGILLYQLIYKKLPLNELAHLQNKVPEFLEQTPIKFNSIPEAIAQLGERCLNTNIIQRIEYQDLLNEIRNLITVLPSIIAEHQPVTIVVPERRKTVEIPQIQVREANNRQPEFMVNFVRQVKQIYVELKQKILIAKKIKREAELKLINLSDKFMETSVNSDYHQYFDETVLEALIMNIKKLKISVGKAETDQQINQNIKQFMLTDLVMLLYNIQNILQQNNSLEDNIKNAQQLLSEHLKFQKHQKPVQYYRQLRAQTISYKDK